MKKWCYKSLSVFQFPVYPDAQHAPLPRLDCVKPHSDPLHVGKLEFTAEKQVALIPQPKATKVFGQANSVIGGSWEAMLDSGGSYLYHGNFLMAANCAFQQG